MSNVTSSSFSGAADEHRRSAVAPATTPGRLRELLLLLGAELPDDAPDAPVAIWQVRAGASLFHEEGPAHQLYVVRTGSFKCQRTAEDGYEQVLRFAFAGDVLGFEGLHGGRQVLSAVALEDARVFALPLHELEVWRRRFAALDHALWRHASAQLAHAGAAAEMLAAVAAEVRLARFLGWLSMRAAEQGQSPRRLLLRMSRREIASLLGVAHETISRAFSALADWGVVKVDNREVEILDAAALQACMRNTRRPVDEAQPLHAASTRVHRPGNGPRSAFPRLAAA